MPSSIQPVIQRTVQLAGKRLSSPEAKGSFDQGPLTSVDSCSRQSPLSGSSSVPSIPLPDFSNAKQKPAGLDSLNLEEKVFIIFANKIAYLAESAATAVLHRIFAAKRKFC